MTGDRIVAVYAVYRSAMEKLGVMENSLFAHYGLTKFLMVYLIREALAADRIGNDFLQHPSAFLEQPKGMSRLLYSIGKLAQTIVRLLDKEINRRSAPDPYDFKRELKSQSAVRDLSSTVLAHYQITIDGDLTPTFSEIWKESKNR